MTKKLIGRGVGWQRWLYTAWVNAGMGNWRGEFERRIRGREVGSLVYVLKVGVESKQVDGSVGIGAPVPVVQFLFL